MASVYGRRAPTHRETGPVPLLPPLAPCQIVVATLEGDALVSEFGSPDPVGRLTRRLGNATGWVARTLSPLATIWRRVSAAHGSLTMLGSTGAGQARLFPHRARSSELAILLDASSSNAWSSLTRFLLQSIPHQNFIKLSHPTPSLPPSLRGAFSYERGTPVLARGAVSPVLESPVGGAVQSGRGRGCWRVRYVVWCCVRCRVMKKDKTNHRGTSPIKKRPPP